MTASGAPTPLDRQQQQVRDWQVIRLLGLGFSMEQTEHVLAHVRTWHDVAALIHRGATPEQVVRILT